MAKTKKSEAQDAATATLPESEAAPSTREEAEQTPPPAETGDKPLQKKEKPEGKKFLTFWERIDAIDAADWGARAVATLYRIEPIIDRTRSTERKYVAKSQQWIDLDRIKMDHGSGRYQLYLNFKEPGKREGRQVDMIEFDILDMKYPPQLPLGEWVEDAKNDKWKWAKEILKKREAEADKAAPAAPQQIGMSPGEVLDLVDRVAERLKPEPQGEQKSAASDLTALVAAAKNIAELKTPPPAAPSTNNDEVKALREDLAYQRTRTDQLMDKLLAQSAAKSQGPSGLESLKDIVGTLKTLLPDARDLLAPALEGVTGGHSRMTGDQEFWQGIITTVVDKSQPLLNLLGQFMLSRALQVSQRPPAPGATPQPAMTQQPGLPQPPQAQPNQQPSPMPPSSPTDVSTPQPEQINQLVMMIGETVATALVEGRAGDAYAESFEGLFGTSAYDQLSALGKERMLQIFQSLPMWEKIGILQSKVPGFIDEFLEYGKEETQGKDADE